jgi:hypothetical protein
MTCWHADVIEDIEAWQRGAPIRVLIPRLTASCQPAFPGCQ